MSKSMKHRRARESTTPAVQHQPWCHPAAHHRDAAGDRCVSPGLSPSAEVSCWLIADIDGARVVVDAAPAGIELDPAVARSLADDLVALATLARDGRP